MTDTQEKELLMLLGRALSEHTQNIELGVALVICFPEHNRIHAVSNLPEDRMTELLRIYLSNLPQKIEG